jgi:hypothetical protein
MENIRKSTSLIDKVKGLQRGELVLRPVHFYSSIQDGRTLPAYVLLARFYGLEHINTQIYPFPVINVTELNTLFPHKNGLMPDIRKGCDNEYAAEGIVLGSEGISGHRVGLDSEFYPKEGAYFGLEEITKYLENTEGYGLFAKILNVMYKN